MSYLIDPGGARIFAGWRRLLLTLLAIGCLAIAAGVVWGLSQIVR